MKRLTKISRPEFLSQRHREGYLRNEIKNEDLISKVVGVIIVRGLRVGELDTRWPDWGLAGPAYSGWTILSAAMKPYLVGKTR